MEDSTQRLQEAIEAARAGQLVEARTIAEELTVGDPENAHAWFLRGILTDDEEQQSEYLNKTLAIDPEHKAARKRMEQMQPPVEEVVEPEVEEEVEPEMDEDATMVGDSATFMAAAAVAGEASAEVNEEAAAFEELFDEAPAEDEVHDTLIAASPFAEEMVPEDVEVEALFGQADASSAADATSAADVADDDDMATVIAAAAFLGEDEAPAEFEEAGEAFEEAQEPELEASDIAAAIAGAAVLDQAGEAWFEEEADDELWSKVEAEAVPDWLIEDTSTEADETLAGAGLDETIPAAEGDAAQDQDLPDWLLDEPEDDWTEVEEVVEEADAFDDVPETVVTAAVAADAVAEDEQEEAAEEEEAPPAKPKKKSPNRGLEIALILLIIVAVLVMAALVYFLVNPPSL